MSWTSLCTVISCLTWPKDTYFCHKQNPVTSWNFHIKQLDTQMEQLFSKSPQFAAKSKPLGNLPEYQPLLPPMFLFLTLVTNWARMHTFNSAFYFCQAIDTHIEERVRHMNQWAWEITIAGCSLTHFFARDHVERCVYSFKWCLSCRCELNTATFWVAHWVKVRRHRRVSVCGLDVD